LDPHDAAIREIASRVEDNQVFIYPTETIYGIGGRADNHFVEQRIMDIKGRNKSSPFIVLGASRSVFKPLGLQFSNNAEALAEAFWPGNITLVLPSEKRPEGIGVRVSEHPFIVALFKHCSVPVYSTSANFSGQEYSYDCEKIFSIIGTKVDFIVDAGNLIASKPSTVVKIDANGSISILREGVVSAERIYSVCKR